MTDPNAGDGGVPDGGVVLEPPPDMPAAPTSGCGCTTVDATITLGLVALWVLSTRRRR